MTLPITLPEPPVFFQSPSRCWAAAYISWHKAQTGGGSNGSFYTPAGLGEFFDSMETRADDPATKRNERVGKYTGNNGAIRDSGLRILSLFGLMSFKEYRPNQVNPRMVGEMLRRSGYVYCVYKSLKRGHAVVIYGASKTHFKIMNPSKGLDSVPISSITGGGNLVIFLGEPGSPRISSEMQADMDRLSVPFRKPRLSI